MTIEGEKDDITGLGQCRAAHEFVHEPVGRSPSSTGVPGVGHYGIFNGSRFRRRSRRGIARQFVREFDMRSDLV